MLIKVLGSSSSGNGYVLQSSDGECLVIEAGVPFKEVLKAVDYNRSLIQGCLISHSHQDHAKHISEYIGFPVFNEPCTDNPQWYQFGSFRFLPFAVTHDVPDNGYIIKHKEMGTLFFATDCMDIPTVFKGINHWLIEANYSDEKLLLSDTDVAQKKRIINSHHSFESCVDYLHMGEAEKSKTITLIHLSSRHSDPALFVKRIQGEFGVPCFIARKGITINLI